MTIAWQTRPPNNPVRAQLIHQLDPLLTDIAHVLGLDLTNPAQLLTFTSRLRIWIDKANQAARDQPGPDDDPLNRHPF
jgi:hypothetical protein